MLKYMLDTNIVIYTMKKKPASVRAAFKKDDGRMGNSNITSITEPSLLRHRERSVAIHCSYSRYRKSLDCHVGMEPPCSDRK